VLIDHAVKRYVPRILTVIVVNDALSRLVDDVDEVVGEIVVTAERVTSLQVGHVAALIARDASVPTIRRHIVLCEAERVRLRRRRRQLPTDGGLRLPLFVARPILAVIVYRRAEIQIAARGSV